MKILAIGGLGFIGHHLSKSLIDAGHEVIILDNMSDYGLFDREELNRMITLRLTRVENASFCIKGDVNEPRLADSIIKDFDPQCVIYLAGFPRAKAVDENLELARQTMITSLSSVAESVKNINSKFVFVSSSMVYGEWPDHSVDELYEPNPKGNYSNLKRQGELLLQQMLPPDQLLIVRPSGVYGPYDVTDRVVSRMMKSAMQSLPIDVHGANTMIDLTYVDDVITMMQRAIESNASGIYNVSSGTATSLLELAQEIISVTGSRSELNIKNLDDRYFQRGALDNTKSKIDMGYEPRYDLKLGLREYHSWLTNFIR